MNNHPASPRFDSENLKILREEIRAEMKAM